MRYRDERSNRWVYILAMVAYVALVVGFAWNTEVERTKAEYLGLVHAEEMASEAAYAWGLIAQRQANDTTALPGDRGYPARMQALTNELAIEAREDAIRAEARLQRLTFGRFHPDAH